MKKATVILSLLIVVTESGSFAQGVQFIYDKWSNILERATQENKIIFVDAYTNWCGPCKLMDRNVFSTRKVGDFFNATFINVKIDMESGEGPALSQQYGVHAFPTLLFINSSGVVIHRGLGYHEPDDLLALARQALDANNNMFALKKQYEKGVRDPEFLYQLALQLYHAQEDGYPIIAEEYLNTQQDWNTRRNLELIYKTSDARGTKMFNYFLRNKELFENAFGSTVVNEKIQYLVQKELDDSQRTGDQTQLKTMLELLYPGRSEEMLERMNMSILAQNEDYEAYAKACINFYKKYKAENWEELNEVAWLFYETIDDRSQLKRAINWAKQSITMDANYFNLDTLALLYHKLGKKTKAIRWAKKAIELAHQQGEDCSSTESWLKNLEQ